MDAYHIDQINYPPQSYLEPVPALVSNCFPSQFETLGHPHLTIKANLWELLEQQHRFTTNTIEPSSLLSGDMRSYAWTRIRTEIADAAKLEANWDGFGSRSITPQTTKQALEVIKLCESVGAEPLWSAPTSDESILLSIRLTDGRDLKFEVDGESSIGLEIRNVEGDYTYHDIQIDSLIQMLA